MIVDVISDRAIVFPIVFPRRLLLVEPNPTQVSSTSTTTLLFDLIFRSNHKMLDGATVEEQAT